MQDERITAGGSSDARDLDREIERAAAEAADAERRSAARLSAERSGQKTPSREGRQVALLGVTGVLFVGLTVANLSGHGLFQLPKMPRDVVAVSTESLRDSLYFEVLGIDEWAEEHGRLPERLEEMGVVDPALRYERLDAERYSLTLRLQGHSLTYDSRRDPGSVFAGPGVQGEGD